MPESIQVDLPPAVLREGEHDSGQPKDMLQLGSQHNKWQRKVRALKPRWRTTHQRGISEENNILTTKTARPLLR
jgi:hypothetical protein